MALAIDFKGVNKWFGQHHFLVDVDLSVDAGEVIVVWPLRLGQEHAHPLRQSPGQRGDP